jgi:hypothetical protein
MIPDDGSFQHEDPPTPDGGPVESCPIRGNRPFIDFGVVARGCASQEQVLVLTNTKMAVPVSLIKVSVSGAKAGSFVVSGPELPLVIQPMEKVSLGVRFRPDFHAVEGGETTAELDVHTACDRSPDEPGMKIFLTGRVTASETTMDVFEVPSKPTADILWCIDNDGPVAGIQSAIAANSGGFFAHLIDKKVDFNLGVVTSEDMNSYEQHGGDVSAGLLYAKKGWPRIISNFPPSPSTEPFQPVITNYEEAFQASITPGDCCSNRPAACFLAVKKALSEPAIADINYNAGFIRKMARLVVITVTNENDNSGPETAEYVDYFKKIKGKMNPAMLSLSVIANLDRDYVAGETGVLPSGVDCKTGTATGDAGVMQAAMFGEISRFTGSGVAATLCKTDWAKTMDRLGDEASRLVIPRQYFAVRLIDESAFEVLVDGKVIPQGFPAGWTLEAETNSVIFGPAVLLLPGSNIVFKYLPKCTQ